MAGNMEKEEITEGSFLQRGNRPGPPHEIIHHEDVDNLESRTWSFVED
jgi:hypothetical protein